MPELRAPWRAWMLALLLLLPAGCAHRATSAGGPVVRVRLLQATDQVIVAATESPTVRAASDSESHRLSFRRGQSVP
ncbi:MAG: hypothetical protein ACREJC_06380, partial [Tepidisphaeraceae bacterium]